MTTAHQRGSRSGSLWAITVAITMIALAITAPGAHAAATRAEYVAQVDPICQAAIGPQAKALNAFSKAFEHFKQRLKSGRITKGRSRSSFARQPASSAGSRESARTSPPRSRRCHRRLETRAP